MKKHEYISSMNPRLLISKFISASGEICNLDKMRKISKTIGVYQFPVHTYSDYIELFPRFSCSIPTISYDEKLDIQTGYLFRCLRLVSTRRNILRIFMATFILILFIKFCTWWLTTDDFVEPLGVYDSTFCRPNDLMGHITVRKATNFYITTCYQYNHARLIF